MDKYEILQWQECLEFLSPVISNFLKRRRFGNFLQHDLMSAAHDAYIAACDTFNGSHPFRHYVTIRAFNSMRNVVAKHRSYVSRLGAAAQGLRQEPRNTVWPEAVKMDVVDALSGSSKLVAKALLECPDEVLSDIRGSRRECLRAAVRRYAARNLGCGRHEFPQVCQELERAVASLNEVRV